MADQQAGSNPPETQSYDADMLADVRGAFEEVAKAEPVADKPIDEKSEPVADKVVAEPRADHPTDEKRYADGTFKPTKEEAAAAVKVEPVKVEPAAKTEPEPTVAQQQSVQAAPIIAPPGGWSPKSKAEWDKLPEHIRSDIAKREKEVADGFSQYEGMRELRPYVEMARARGQSLKQALDSYTGIENALRNPQQALNAILHVAGNAGYTPQRLVAELAPHVGHTNGQQNGAMDGSQLPFDPSMFQQWLNPLTQQLSTLQSQVQQFQQADQQRYDTAFNAAHSRFASDPAHRYFENVRPQMAQLFKGGLLVETGDVYADLKAAYDMACNMNPEIRELLLNERIAKTEELRKAAEREAAEKARHASRSITGSPSSGAVRDDGSKGDGSIEDDVRSAYRQHAA